MDPIELINKLSRERITDLLEGTGTACFDDELTQELRDCLAESVDAGDVDEMQLFD